MPIASESTAKAVAAEAVKRPERREASRVAALFLVALDRAEFHARLPRRVGGRRAAVDQIAHARVEVLPQLVAHVALEARAREESVDGAAQAAQHATPHPAGASARRP